MKSPDVIIVGGGAAGIIAAWKSATLGAKTLLLEKTERLGTKILISGGGKCNITHDGTVEEVLQAFRKNEAQFLRPAMYRFTNSDVLELLTSRGLEVYTRPDNRIFPLHGTAKDVMKIFESCLREVNVSVLLRTPVKRLIAAANRIEGVETANGNFYCQRVVIATGGSSYPKSGTTGDAWKWLRELGHKIVPIRAALAPMYMEIENQGDLSGISIRDCVLKARQRGKEIARWRGDLLFTHRGVSGPTVLGISRIVAEQWHMGPIMLEVDLLPDSSFESVSEKISGYRQSFPKRSVARFLSELIAEGLVQAALQSRQIVVQASMGTLDRKTQNRLVELIKGWQIGEVTSVPLEKGECVAGGVSLDEVDPHSMRSSKVQGLYLSGEALDIAGPVGGYNLQAAFSTGFVAGETAAKDCETR
ncbi:MAG: aminoacetone oxidase family FAD-binding enzyme [Fimbriimonadales bacterium]|nr:aminoacetone oxidase family FAD-binding enzyme [Fimbriimonadales bacterium]